MNRYIYSPDNNHPKVVYLQAAGHEISGNARHVLIAWPNGTYASTPVRQIIQLGQNANGYHYDPKPVAELYTDAMARNHTVYNLGTLTRAQRDRVLELAKQLPFVRTSRVNGCRVWTRDLLQKMVDEGFILQETFDHVDSGVPLAKRLPEI